MDTLVKTKAITLRLDQDLHRSITRIAQHRKISVNSLVQEQLELSVRIEEERTRYDSYTLLGQDVEEANAEYAIYAQAEVMHHDES